LADICEFGIPEIDNGHDRIILMINEIGDCIQSGNLNAALEQVIHLIAVERKHMMIEADLLAKYGYDRIEEHDDYHTTINGTLNLLMLALGDGDGGLASKIYNDLIKDFVDDILKADLPFKSLLQHRMMDA